MASRGWGSRTRFAGQQSLTSDSITAGLLLSFALKAMPIIKNTNSFMRPYHGTQSGPHPLMSPSGDLSRELGPGIITCKLQRKAVVCVDEPGSGKPVPKGVAWSTCSQAMFNASK